MKSLKTRIFKNWESTICGLIGFALLGLYIAKIIDTEKMITSLTVVTSVFAILYKKKENPGQSQDGNYYK